MMLRNHGGAILGSPPNEIRPRRTAINRLRLEELGDFISRLFFTADLGCPGLLLTVGILLGVSGSGCQSLQKRTTQRSAQCGDLCARAQEARDRGNADQANQLINEAIRQKASDTESRRQLAAALWKNGRKDEALAQFAELCAEQPKDVKLSAELAVMQWESDRPDAAAVTALTLLERNPQSKEAWLIKARFEMSTGNLDDALSSYLRLSQLAPDDLTMLMELGELHLKRGYPDRACPLFRAAMHHSQATQAQRVEMEWKVGLAYSRSEQWSLAVKFLEQSAIRRVSSAEDWCLLGRAHLQCGDLVAATSDLERGYQADSHSSAVRLLARDLEMVTESKSPNQKVTPAGHLQRS